MSLELSMNLDVALSEYLCHLHDEKDANEAIHRRRVRSLDLTIREFASFLHGYFYSMIFQISHPFTIKAHR